METAVRDKIAAKLAVADEYQSKGEFESVRKVLEEVKSIRDAADSEAQIKAHRKALSDGVDGGVDTGNSKPVVTQEAEIYAQNHPEAKAYRADFKPAGYVDGLSPAIQTKWVRESMGDNLKASADHYKATWMKWFRSHRDSDFFKMANGAEIKAMQENTDNEGGFFVPEEYRTTVIHDTGVPGGVHRPRCTQITTGLKDGYLPTLGSVTWAAIAEEAAYGDNTPTIGQVSFTIRKSGGKVKVSQELLEDAQANLPALLAQIFAESSGRYEDQQIVEGDGTTEPEGLRTTAGGDVLLASATAIALADLHNVYYTLPAQFRANAAWSTTSNVLADIDALDRVAATQSISAAIGQQWLGKPIAVFDGTGWDDAAAIAANEEIGAFGDFRNYYLIDRVGMTLRRDDSIYVDNDQVGFFARRRFDGRVGLSAAFRIVKAAAS